MSKIWLTSDSHYNHKSICGPTLSKWKDGYRNFSSLQEMEEILTDNINSLVQPDDILYHLGDFIMGPSIDVELPRIRSTIKCKTIHKLRGNHNKYDKWSELKSLFTTFQDYLELKYKSKFIVLCHYPFRSWNHMNQGSLHFHGHTHQQIGNGRMLDVGVDCWNFKPISIEQAIDECMKKSIIGEGHHQPEDN
jgi:calcineurin-like phosphoesterase family protein